MLWSLRVSSWLLSKILILMKPYFWIRDRSPPPKIPPANNSLLNISAVQLAKKIRNGEMTSEYIVETYIKRIKDVNPFLNAVVDDRFEAALADAKLCDKMLAHGEVTITELESKMPFFGVPITVKESCSLKGLSYTGCTMIREGLKAKEDSLIVQSMKAAGAIPLCVTNTPELCSGFETINILYGTTCNPYDTRHSAGGSSGGEGALLGAGASTIGIGSDLAGSIRLPALFDGIFGHKPTPGIIPIEGHFPIAESEQFRKYLVLGPMTRYAEDLNAAMKVMSAGCDVNLRLDEPVDITKLKVFYMKSVKNNYGLQSIGHDIQRAIYRAATHFKNCGAKVDEVILPEMAESCEIGILSVLDMPDVPNVLINRKNPKVKVNVLLELLKASVGRSNYSKSAIFMETISVMSKWIPSSQKQKYVKKATLLENKLIKMLGDDGVFFYPTFPTVAPPIGQVIFQTICAMFCLLSNIFGFPATEVPMGLNRNGLPIGFQVLAAPNNDRLCLAVAMELEKAFGGWTPPASTN